MSTVDCTVDTCPISDSVYSYRPSLAANACFLTFFAITGLAHIVQGILTKKRAFWISVALGCIGEIVGYAGRIISHFDPFSQIGFLIQICCLTIAPAFFAAAIYFTLGDIVRAVSPARAASSQVVMRPSSSRVILSVWSCKERVVGSPVWPVRMGMIPR